MKLRQIAVLLVLSGGILNIAYASVHSVNLFVDGQEFKSLNVKHLGFSCQSGVSRLSVTAANDTFDSASTNTRNFQGTFKRLACANGSAYFIENVRIQATTTNGKTVTCSASIGVGKDQFGIHSAKLIKYSCMPSLFKLEQKTSFDIRLQK